MPLAKLVQFNPLTTSISPKLSIKSVSFQPSSAVSYLQFMLLNYFTNSLLDIHFYLLIDFMFVVVIEKHKSEKITYITVTGLWKIHTFSNCILQPASCVSACVVTRCEPTAHDDEVKCGGLVIEQPRQQDSAVKETRVRRSRVGDGERGGGQQREPTESEISWSSSPTCMTQ